MIINKYQTINCTTTETIEKMPPELIVTPAKQNKQHGNDTVPNCKRFSDEKNAKKSPTLGGTAEFPPIEEGRGTRRTHSWHNLNTKNVPKMRVNSLINPEPNVDNLQLKLSLRKQIWTGVSSDGTSIDKNRPLSWGIPPISKTRVIYKDDSEALLTACSQKLAEWQQSEMGVSARKNKVTINLVVPNIPDKMVKPKKNTTVKHQNSKLESSTRTIDQSVKKIRNPLSKIAETTHILSRLTKSKSKAVQSNHRKYSQPITTSVFCGTNTAVSIMPSLGSARRRHHKFKTGGIVATAVQPVKKKKPRSLPLSSLKLNLNDSNNSTESESEKPPFLRKIKTKIRKRKNKI